ncbi:MAG TPA: hypothetical protein ENJ95_01810 [Bacteroidetes bacterium]|nr:hypothetical protein [Bacteroidota bacterium]
MKKHKTYLQELLLSVSVLGLSLTVFSQNPHGEDFKANCAACHSSSGWEIHAEHWENIELAKSKVSEKTGLPLPTDTSLFHHNKTGFLLEGQHASTDCRSCHETLVFAEAKSECISCHTDMHQMTLGDDCARCHSSENWLVDNITELHQDNGFPLLGGHAEATCTDCHLSETALRFDRIGNDCINCHLDDFHATTNPDHAAAGFSTNCAECHDINNLGWNTEVVDHSFFPLTEGHEINDCAACHTAGDFANTPTDCFACHQPDFEATENPDHQAADFPTDCAACHTTDVGWAPADFPQHDGQYFPIYSGTHEGTWNECLDCHTDASDYSLFTCTTCHENPETDSSHDGVSGYSYENTACLACHPAGNADGSFDHDATDFPLTGGHVGLECLACHADGFAGTPTDCAACHSTDFQQTINPDHEELNFSTDCASCHTTEPDWMPATFANHDDFYQLNGAHAAIANDCAQCHNGDYNNTPNTCVGCHADDYNLTLDPPHASLQFSTECQDCHTEDEWMPATFDHDGQYFPIYSGAHEGEWNECTDCHTNPANYAEFSCTNCHVNPETDNQHSGINGYSFDDPACLACHPTGNADDGFDHNMTAFPLTGAHLTTDCIECHSAGYAGTPTDCAACHIEDFNQTINPDHEAGNFPTDCSVCHSTDPGWSPAGFAQHDDFFPLTEGHEINDCAACHTGGVFENTPTDCFACHEADFQNTSDPDHEASGFPTDCSVCHSTAPGWEADDFNQHDDLYFPIFSGKHKNEWNECNECHTTPGDFMSFSCIDCHEHNNANHLADEHDEVSGYSYSSQACYTCHPTGHE